MDIRGFFKPKSKASGGEHGRIGRTKRKAAPVIIDDDEDDFVSKPKQSTKTTSKVKQKRSRPPIQYDTESEEDASTSQSSSALQQKQDFSSSSSSHARSNTSCSSGNSKVNGAEGLKREKEVASVSAFFGSTPVKRVSKSSQSLSEAHPVDNENKLTKSRSKSTSSSPSVVPESPSDDPKEDKEEKWSIAAPTVEFHDDNFFTQTLKQLDHYETNRSSPPAKKLKRLVDKESSCTKPTHQPKRQKTPTPPCSTSPPPHSHTPPTPNLAKHDIKNFVTDPSLPPPAPSLTHKTSNYLAYLNRGGPRALGSKEIPMGAENCLDGLTFVFTGVLDSLEREDAMDLVKRYGGRVTGNISKKTSYVVMGEGAGESKLSKARKLGTKQISEDDLLELIRTLPSKTTSLTTPTHVVDKQSKRRPSSTSSHSSTSPQASMDRKLISNEAILTTPSLSLSTTPTLSLPSTPTLSGFSNLSTPTSTQPKTSATPTLPHPMRGESCAVSTTSIATTTKGADPGPNLMWVDRYRPKTTKQIIGQQGEKSCVKKLTRWLRDWYTHHSGEGKGKAKGGHRKGGWGSGDDGLSMKAALLSGPPGVGKTTSATLVCEEQGFTYTELNASATRSKKCLQDEVSTQLSNLAIDAFITGTGRSSSSIAKRHVLIMDEVDGMAGNEDRGGMQELIQLIKSTRIPIICICNDRQHPKVRSLANYCYDLRFMKPRLEQIKGPMMSIAFKEGVKMSPQALNEVIAASGHDIRQVLHNLSVWTAASRSLSYNDAKSSAQNAKKEMKQSPFDVIRSVFMPVEGGRELTFMEKSDLFFKDYSLGPLFVQENYPSVKLAAKCDMKQTLHCLSCTADAIACGDIVSKAIRTASSFGLLPVQAVFSSVIPGECMRGYVGKPEFPVWLGNNSKAGRSDRLMQELRQHTCLNTSSCKLDFGMNYVPHLRYRLTSPLIRQEGEGVAEVVAVMQAYDLVREDWDTINELAHYSTSPDPTDQIASKVKAAFTRTLNKEYHALPYAVQVNFRKRSRASFTDSDLLEEEEVERTSGSVSSEEEDEDICRNAMVKMRRQQSDDSAEMTMLKGHGKGPAKGGGKTKAGKKK